MSSNKQNIRVEKPEDLEKLVCESHDNLLRALLSAEGYMASKEFQHADSKEFQHAVWHLHALIQAKDKLPAKVDKDSVFKQQGYEYIKEILTELEKPFEDVIRATAKIHEFVKMFNEKMEDDEEGGMLKENLDNSILSNEKKLKNSNLPQQLKDIGLKFIDEVKEIVKGVEKHVENKSVKGLNEAKIKFMNSKIKLLQDVEEHFAEFCYSENKMTDYRKVLRGVTEGL